MDAVRGDYKVPDGFEVRKIEREMPAALTAKPGQAALQTITHIEITPRPSENKQDDEAFDEVTKLKHATPELRASFLNLLKN